jgi:hypothetical protein
LDKALLDEAVLQRDPKTGSIKSISFNNANYDLDVSDFSYSDLTYGNSAWVRYFLEDHIELMMYKKGFVYSVEELENFVQTGDNYLNLFHPEKKVDPKEVEMRKQKLQAEKKAKEKAKDKDSIFNIKNKAAVAEDKKEKGEDKSMNPFEFTALWNSPPPSLLGRVYDGYSVVSRTIAREEARSPVAVRGERKISRSSSSVRNDRAMSVESSIKDELESLAQITPQRRTFKTTSGFGRDRNIFAGNQKRSFVLSH